MRAYEGFSASNISVTTASFILKFGGIFVMTTQGQGFGSVTLQILGGDGVTWITAATAVTANGMSGPLSLPAGTYRFAISNATAVYVNLNRVPGE